MCAIVDTNVFGLVFNSLNTEHKEYYLLNRWLYKGKGKLVYGGDKYATELTGGLFRRTVLELNRMGKTVILNRKQVNDYAKKLKAMIPDKDFDDEHLVAIVALSGCRVVCTDEKRAIPYLRRKDLYPKGIKPPKIYRHSGASMLCRDCNIAPVCRSKKK
jgi:hypothetical protein